MSLFLAMADCLPNFVVEIVTGSAKLHFSAPFVALGLAICFLMTDTDERMLVTPLRNFMIVLIIRIIMFSKSIGAIQANMVP